MATQFQSVSLFGGAITAQISSDFADVSEIREVPDNQEVYVARKGLTSIIFEIMERVEPPRHSCNSDEEALLYHYRDIIEPGHVREEQGATAPQEEGKVWTSNKAVVEHLPATPAYTLLATQRPLSSAFGKPEFTAIILTLIRLPKQATDILITINVPHISGEYNEQATDLAAAHWGPMIGAALEDRARLLSTFKIQDWDLFVT